MHVGWDDSQLCALIVETDPSFDASKSPLVSGNWLTRIIRIAPSCELRCFSVKRNHRVAARRCTATQRHAGLTRRFDNEFGTHRSRNRRAVTVACDRHVEQHSPIARQKVALPSAPNDRIAASHQEAIPRVIQRTWVVGTGCIIKELQRPNIAAITIIEKQPTVALGHVGRFQDDQVGGKFDKTTIINRCITKVDDSCLRRGQRIDGKMRTARQFLIDTAAFEGVPTRKRFTLCDTDLDLVRHAGSSLKHNC